MKDQNNSEEFLLLEEPLVEDLIQFSNSPQSRQFYRKSINELGEEVVYCILSEAKMLAQEGKIEDKARYLTALLKKELPSESHLNAQKSPIKNEIENLMELASKEIEIENLPDLTYYMQTPYSNDLIHSPRFISQDFFTLPQDKNKNKSDEIKTVINIQGKPITANLVRGRQFEGDRDRGILTTEHARILNAIENIWVQQGCRFRKDDNNNNICFCEAELKEICRLIGVKKLSGQYERFLKIKVSDLDKTAYYIYNFKNNNTDIKGIGFKVVASSTFINRNEKGKSSFKVVFSEVYSRFLIERKTLSRPLDMLKIRNEIGYKMYIYLFPRMMKSQFFKIKLVDLIQFLNLPKAKWHKINRERKRQFSKAIRHLNGKIINSKKLECYVLTENKIHFLVSKLVV